jgi:glycosyltransferase involved in cell wall biosynthesis
MKIVDVVIPVYNGARFLTTAIESAMGQTYPINRVIVVDDGSTDSTLRILKDLEARYTILSAVSIKHSGLSATRNAGWKLSNAELIAFLDVDDSWSIQKIEHQVAHLENHDRCNVVFSSSILHNEKNSKISFLDGINHCSATPLNILTKNFVISGSASSVIIKRNLLEELNGFDENLGFGEDLDLWIRASEFSGICGLSHRDVNILKSTGGMQSNVRDIKSIFKHNILIYKMIEKNFSPKNLKSDRKALRNAFWGDLKKNVFFGLRNFHSFYADSKNDFPVATSLLFSNYFDFLLSFLSAILSKLFRITWRLTGVRN